MTTPRPVSQPCPACGFPGPDTVTYIGPVSQPAERERLAVALDDFIRVGENPYGRDVDQLADIYRVLIAKAKAVRAAIVSSGDERPERFDRTWWHYADDCPVPPVSGDDERLRATGAALRAAIDAACSLNNPRLSEVDWDQVAKVWGER